MSTVVGAVGVRFNNSDRSWAAGHSTSSGARFPFRTQERSLGADSATKHIHVELRSARAEIQLRKHAPSFTSENTLTYSPRQKTLTDSARKKTSGDSLRKPSRHIFESREAASHRNSALWPHSEIPQRGSVGVSRVFSGRIPKSWLLAGLTRKDADAR